MATERRDCNATRYEPMLVASRPVASRRIVGQLAVPQTTVGKLASRLLMGGVLLGGAGFGSLAIAQQTASAYPSSTAQATESLADASPLFVSQSSEGPAQTLAQMPTAPLPGSNMAAVNLNSYILGSGDQVTLSVVGYPEFTGTLAVLPDGSVTLPLVGAVRAAGLTPSQLSQVLTQQLSVYLVEPAVSVGVAVMRPVVVTVSGEVHRPGPLQLSSLSDGSTSTFNVNNAEAASTNARLQNQSALPTLSSAVLLAGGVTRDADIRQVTVRRPLPNGQVQLLSFNLWEAITSDAGMADLSLRDGDSIYIPTLEGDAIDRRTVASSSLAPSTVRVKVVGEVVTPGEIAVPPNSSISSAVAIAGGPTTDAQLNSVSLVRLNDQGEIQQQDIDLTNLVDDYQVEEGDVIVVAKRGYLSVVDGIGRVLNPLNIFRLFGF